MTEEIKETNPKDNELPLEERVILFTQTYLEVFGSDSSTPNLKPVGMVSVTDYCLNAYDSQDTLTQSENDIRKKALDLGAKYVFNVKHNITLAINSDDDSRVILLISGDAYKREI